MTNPSDQDDQEKKYTSEEVYPPTMLGQMHRMTERIAKALHLDEPDAPQQIPQSVFRQFEVLYNTDAVLRLINDHPDEFKELSAKWWRTIDKYRPIRVIDDITKDVLYTLPARLPEIAAINGLDGNAEHDLSAYQAAQALNRNPIYNDQLFNNVIGHLRDAQLTDANIKKIKAGRDSMSVIMDQLNEQKMNGERPSSPTSKHGETGTTADDFE